jgi:hypothetical protein
MYVIKRKKEVFIMANKKMTKRDYFEAIKSKYALTNEEIAFIDHELELLEKKNSSKSSTETKTQKANNDIKANLLNEMESGKAYTITDMQKELPCCKDLSNQKISALLRQLIADGEIVRFEEKRKVFFKKAY